MHRHAFSNGAYPSQGGSTFSIQPHKYVLQLQCPALRFRRTRRSTTTTPRNMSLTTTANADSSHGHNLRCADGDN
jgi:hypothetical protein